MASNWFDLQMKTSNARTCPLTRDSRGLCPERLPEIQQAELQVEDAFIGLDIAKANRYPRLFASYNIALVTPSLPQH